MPPTIEKLNAAERVKVKMLTSVAGLPLPQYGLNHEFTYLHDKEVSIHPTLAAHWAENGQCEILK